MPRNALKQRKRGFDPHAFEFTGEEAIQADNAAKARPTFRTQKLSILSALPDVPNPFTALTGTSILAFKRTEDRADTRDADNEHKPKSTARRFRHSLGVARRETKRNKGGREKTAPRTKRKVAKRKAALEAMIGSSIQREVTPDPPAPSIPSTTQESSEASSALRRSGRKRYRTVKALQVYEQSRQKSRTPKRRRNSQDVDPNIRGNETALTCVAESRESFKKESDPSTSNETHHPVRENKNGLDPSRFEETEVPSQLETLDEPRDNEESSEAPNETPLGNRSDKNPLRIDSKALTAKNVSDTIVDGQNESRCSHSSSGHSQSLTEGSDIDGDRTKDLEPRSSSKPSMTQTREGQFTERGQLSIRVHSESSMPEDGISDQNEKEDSRNSTSFHAQREKSHDSQKQCDDAALTRESKPSPPRRVSDPVQKDQDSDLNISPVTPMQLPKIGLGDTSDPKDDGEMRDATEEKNSPQRLEIKGSITSSENLTPVTTVAQRTGSPDQAPIATRCDGQPGLTNPTKQKLEAHPRESSSKEDSGPFEEPSSPLKGKASLKSGNTSSIVVRQPENAALPVVTKSSKGTLGDSVMPTREVEFQDVEASEVNGCDEGPIQNLTTGEALKSIKSDHSVKPRKHTKRSRSEAEVPEEISKDNIQPVSLNEERRGRTGADTGVPIRLMEFESEPQMEGSTEEMQRDLSSDAPPSISQTQNEDIQSAVEADAKLPSSHPKQSDFGTQHISLATTSQGKRKVEEDCDGTLTTTNLGEQRTPRQAQLALHDSRKSKQTFSKRVRFAEPERSSLPSVGRKGFSDIMKMRLRKARRKQVTPLVPHGVTVMTIRGSGPNAKERRVFLDELQYLLDGIFKPSGKAEQKSPQLESQLISKTLISLTQLLTRKSRDVKSSEEDGSNSTLIQILSTQPSLFSSIVSQLCGVFGKSRSIDAMLAVVFVLIFRATPKLLLISATELDILLNAFFRSSAAALKEDEMESSGRSSATKGNKEVDTKKRRGRLAKRFEESKAESSVLSALNRVVAEAAIAEEEFSGFRNEAVAASHLIGTALSLAMCFHGNLRSLMQENRRLDKVVAVLYSCEKLMVQKTDSCSEERKLQFVHKEASNEASTSWVVLGASLKILEFAILDKVCQARTARESRLCAIVVNVIRSVDCLRESMFGSEWILSAALRVAINLCHGFEEASHQFVKQKGHELVLMWVVKESYVAGLLSGGGEHLSTDGIDESFDVRVLCLALLATIVDQERDVCDQFHTMNVDGFTKRNAGGLEIATEILHAAEMILEAGDAEANSEDVEEEGRRRSPDALARTQHAERAEIMLEKKITIGYASLLIGALVQENVKNRKLAEKLIPSSNLVGVAAVLTQFLEFHHEVGIISGSMDRMYARIIDSLVRPFQGLDAAMVEGGRS